jgi:hypothetical protein
MCAGAAMVHCQCQCQWLQRQQSHWPQRGWGRAPDPEIPDAQASGFIFPIPAKSGEPAGGGL